MTVSKIHEYMTEMVVPESVMPQNISICLMDEDTAAIPELDAFTFLNRVRALGIGSADFLYLLKGCNAPEQAIEKIENNPAMNLQSLIVTLEESGLTPQDYTRMLYTARQIWEKTLTMRLDQVNEEEAERYIPEENPQTDEIHMSSPAHDDSDGYGARFSDEDDGDEYFDDGYDYYDDYEDSPYHNGKIAAGIIGGVVLIGACAAIGMMGFNALSEKAPTTVFAADNTEVFTAVYNAYSANASGGKSIILPPDNNAELFDTMLIEDSDELGVYAVGDSGFAASSELITVYTEHNDTISTLCTIVPPEGAEFIKIIEGKEQLTAVFSDEDSVGFAAYGENGNVLYTSHLLGTLTDINVDENGNLSFGTIYTPKFTESFTSEKTDKYLPIISTAGKVSTIPATQIALTEGSVGCSYAVYGKFNLEDGSLLDCTAALGDPVYSDAEKFMAAMKTNDGYEIIIRGEDNTLQSTTVSGMVACDMGNSFVAELSESTEPYDSVITFERTFNLIATAQKEMDNSTTIYLRGFDFEPVSAVTNIPVDVSSLRMEDGTLYIYDKNGVAMLLNTLDPAKPEILQYTNANGVIRKDYALCSDISGSLLKFTLYKLDESGTAVAVGSTTKSVNAAEDTLPEICGANTFYIGGENRCAAAFTYFDGVSVISEFALFGKTNTSHTLFDDKNGFSAAVPIGEKLHLVYGNKSIAVK